jgi:hypothetical protein
MTWIVNPLRIFIGRVTVKVFADHTGRERQATAPAFFALLAMLDFLHGITLWPLVIRERHLLLPLSNTQ